MESKRNRKIGLITAAALVFVFLLILEAVHPYYFLKNDNIDSYICLYRHSYESFKDFSAPLYSFDQNLGMRFLAMGQTGSFDPFVYVSFFLSNIFFGGYRASIEIMALLHLVLAAVFMYILCGRLRIKTLPSVIAAISWPLSSFVIYYGRVWFIVILAASWIPLMLWGSLSLLSKELSLKNVFLAAFPKVLLFYCGHPQFFAYAVMFELLFLMVFAAKEKGDVSAGKVFLRYVITMIPVVLLCLPLMLPMWDVMSSGAARNGALTKEKFLDRMYDIRSFLIGILIPYMQVDAFEVKNTFNEIAINVSHFGYVLLGAGIFGAVAFCHDLREWKKAALKGISQVALAAFVSFLAAFVFCTVRAVYSVIYLIPIMNRFRWPFKMTLNALFFVIILCAYELGKLLDGSRKTGGRVISVILTAAVIINFGTLYMVAPSKYEGTRVEGNLDERKDYYDLVENGRYVTIGFPQFIYNDDLSQEASHTYELNFNIASYYGFENISEYGIFDQGMSDPEDGSYEVIPLTGSICNPTEAFIGKMRTLGVNVYLVSGYSWFGQYKEESFSSEKDGSDMYKFIEDHGMILKFDEGDFRVYEDPYAGHVVGYEDSFGTEVRLDHETKDNSVFFATSDDFDGGTVDVRYRYDDNLNCYIDGNKSDITRDPDTDTMKIDIPSGAHDVEIRYEDPLFTWGIITALAGMAVFVIAYTIVGRSCGKRSGSDNNLTEVAG